MALSNKSLILVGLAGLSMTSGVLATAEATNKAAAGLQQIADGIQMFGQQAAEARGAMQAKTQKFVDAAGNVYDVLTDSLGQATKFVVDATGAILDSTKISGAFVLDTLISYPQDLREGLGESAQSAREYAAAGLEAMQEFGQIAMDARPEFPPLQQMLNPGAWKDAAKENGQRLTNAFGQMENQLLAVYDDVEAEFCKPAVFETTTKLPTEITMPGFYIEVGLGKCEGAYADAPLTEFDHNDAFNCTKPYAEIVHMPGKFVAKHHRPIKFKSKECKKETFFGDDELITLFEFDGHDTLDLERVRGTISNALGGLQTGVNALTDQVSQFMSGLDQIPTSIQDKLAGLGKYGSMPVAF